MSYREWRIRKNKGSSKFRLLEVPDQELKRIQRRIADQLKKMPYRLPSFITGSFGSTAGTQNTARPHIDPDIAIRFDVKNFFTSVTREMVYKSLSGEIGLNKFQAAAISWLCTRNNHLPQGAPSSSILANIAAMNMHKALNEYAVSIGCKYTVYVDDIYFSGPASVDLESKKQEIRDIANRFGFDMSPEKIKVMKRGKQQQIMDVCIVGVKEWGDSQHIRLSKAKRRQMMCAIHNLFHLKPKNTVPHIRGLLSNAKRVSDQSYAKALDKFTKALAKWREYLDANPVILKEVTQGGQDATNSI